MQVIDRGAGEPIVVIPGIQGRWEWMEPAIAALSERGRVITFSLADEPSAHAAFDERAGFANYVEQVRAALDQCGLECAAICGVSYGGLIAALFAAHYPHRTSTLVLVSALPPSWRPDARVLFYTRFPWLLTPLFCLASLRLYHEIAAANDTTWRGIRAACGAGLNAVMHMFHPARMARRVHLLSSLFQDEDGRRRIDAELRSVTVPTMVVTGEDALERVVPPSATRQYVALWPHTRVLTLARTGHLGLITRPAEFSELVWRFVSESAAREDAVRARTAYKSGMRRG
jgi:pimeloyl-ACP methyl ester carboxylesterase